MAYQAKDGRQFTNRPQMKAHDQRVTADQSVHEEREKQMITEMGAMHGMSVTCPQCGHQFEHNTSEAHQELEKAGEHAH